MTTFGPHIERLEAVASTPAGGHVLIGGRREVDADDAARALSSVPILVVPELKAAGALAMPHPTTALACATDDVALIGNERGELHVAQIGAQTFGAAVAAHGGAVRGIATFGNQVASVGDDGALKVWTLEGGTLSPAGELSLGARPLLCVAFDARGERIVVGGDASEVVVVPAADLGATPRRMPTPEGVGAVLTTDDGRVVAGCLDGSLHVGYLEGAPEFEHRSKGIDHERAIVGIVRGPALLDDVGRALPRRLYTVARDAALRVWDLDSRKRPKTHELGGDPSAMAWVAAAPNAASQTGGLVVVGRTRRVDAIALEPDATVGQARQVKSRLAELAKAAKASAEKARKAALDTIGGLPEDDARRLLDRSLTSDGAPAMRGHAAVLIGRSARRASRPALRTALGDKNAGVRKAALDALTSIERDRPLAVAQAALASPAPDMRIVALARLPMLRKASPLVPGLIAQRLKDGDSKVRLAALDALVSLDGPESIEPARTAFARGEADVKREALYKLARARLALTTGAEIVEAALDDESSDVRQAAVSVAIGCRAPLVSALSSNEVLMKQLAAAQAEGAFPQETIPLEKAKEPLFAMLACRNVGSAIAGASALATLRDERATGAILQLSRNPQASVRRIAIGVALQAIRQGVGLAALRGRLEWLLADDDDGARTAAFDALEGLAGKDGSARLDLSEIALRCPHPAVRRRGLQLLVAFGGEGEYAGDSELGARADNWLGHALDDEDAKTRDEAFRTLWAWHSASPEPALSRASRARHPDLRGKIVDELLRLRKAATEEQPAEAWVEDLLVELASDSSFDVARKAYEGLLALEVTRVDLHAAALRSSSEKVLALACSKLPPSAFLELRPTVLQLIEDERSAVHLAAIRCFDRLKPGDEVAFTTAFGSVFYELRVRAIELCAARRDRRCVEPARRLLTLPLEDPRRPVAPHRQRLAQALANTGVTGLIPFFITLLQDTDPLVAEQAARGMATAVLPGGEGHLVDWLSHESIAVRSWLAEGLARLGDPRGLPVLIGTLQHDHRPIRLGAIMGFAALGPEGARGLLMALDDQDREIQELVFGVVVARDQALAKKALAADLLSSAMSSSHPEIRFAAARLLEERGQDGTHERTRELIGPRRPQRAADMKNWPEEAQQEALLRVVVEALASDDPPLRYAATQLLALRPQAETFWREAARLQGPRALGQIRIPHTTWSAETRAPRKKSWMHSLVRAAGTAATDQEVAPLVFGVYAGLVRQAPAAGAADETHRIRRDALGRVEALAPVVGRDATVPVLRRGLSDPHHLVRKAASTALKALHPGGPGGDPTPYRLMFQSDAPDVGRGAVDELVALATDANAPDAAAKALVVEALEASHAEVRAHALARLPSLYESGSLEPWLLALGSRFSDVRLQVVDRLVASTGGGADDARISEALGRAMESEHVDLQLKAATTLAFRGDPRTVGVLAGLLRNERAQVVTAAQNALVALARKQPDGDAPLRDEIAQALVARFTDDPDGTANKPGLLKSIGDVRSLEARPLLLTLLTEENGDLWSQAMTAARAIATGASEKLPNGTLRLRFNEAWLHPLLDAARRSVVAKVRKEVIAPLQHFEDASADATLSALTEDRDEEVRVGAIRALAFRAEKLDRPAARDALAAALRIGRRELVLPAAVALAESADPSRTRQVADSVLQSLLLVLKAGLPTERPKAVLALGALGDVRALDELQLLAHPPDDADPEDRMLIGDGTEALARLLKNGDLTSEVAAPIREYIDRTALQGTSLLRSRAMIGLGYIADEAARTLLERVLGDPHDDSTARVQAARLLGQLANKASEQALADAMLSPDWQVRKIARESLTKIFPEDATRVALHALQSPFHDLNSEAAAYLAREGDAATLLSRLADIDSPHIRQRLRAGLLRRGLAPVDALRTLLRGEKHGPREDAAWMAGEKGDGSLAPDVAQAAAKALADAGETSHVRTEARAALTAALWAAERLGSDVTDTARKALDLNETRVTEVARRVLLERLDARELAGWLDTAAPPDRALAARAIVRRFPDQVASVLTSLHAPDPTVALILAAALDLSATFEQPKVRRAALPPLLARGEDTLIAKSKTGDEATRLVALSALGRGGGEAAQAALEALLTEDAKESETIRKAAFKSLRRVQRRLERDARFEESTETGS